MSPFSSSCVSQLPCRVHLSKLSEVFIAFFKDFALAAHFCQANMVNLECRMYENEFPEPDDVVMVLVKEIQEMGGYVHLMEYNNCQGMIMLSELSRRRIRSVNKLLKVGRQEVAASCV